MKNIEFNTKTITPSKVICIGRNYVEHIEEIQTFMTLEDGDIIMSDTPKGVGNYKVGDIFVGKIYSDDKLLVRSEWKVF